MAATQHMVIEFKSKAVGVKAKGMAKQIEPIPDEPRSGGFRNVDSVSLGA